mmetsp:Transcript_63840/g.165879  ORF Transcript_63840/g.165879 Transcript_63840/m.165879 type:complete len:307 (-) Transcript_63840:1936-2856(-)
MRTRQRPPAEEIISKWWTLTLDERQKVMTFHDKGLVGCIAEALHTLWADHEAAVAAGFRLCAEEPDPFRSSPLLGEAFTFGCSGRRSTENPSRAIVNMACNAMVMKMRDGFLESDNFFEQLRHVLPDLLAPQHACKRAPLPMPYWKQLWAVLPTSFSALEQQLAKTVEQALWAMGSDPQLAVRCAKGISAAVDVTGVDEEWMYEAVPTAKLGKVSSTPSKKKRKQKGAKVQKDIRSSTTCSSDTSQSCDTKGDDSEDQRDECLEPEPHANLVVAPVAAAPAPASAPVAAAAAAATAAGATPIFQQA